jgi:hypothetical protein
MSIIRGDKYNHIYSIPLSNIRGDNTTIFSVYLETRCQLSGEINTTTFTVHLMSNIRGDNTTIFSVYFCQLSGEIIPLHLQYTSVKYQGR